MSEENVNEAQAPEEGAKKGGPMKAIVLVVAILLIEAVTIVGTMMLSGGPEEVKGEDIQADVDAELNKPVEVMVVEGKFDNQRTGRTYIYAVEIVALVKQKHAEQFQLDLESMQTQVSVAIQTIIRRADPVHFQEPTFATLTRQIKAALDGRFGTDADDNPIIDEVLIAKCLGTRMDY